MEIKTLFWFNKYKRERHPANRMNAGVHNERKKLN